MQHDAWFFVGIFAFIFLIWITTGGPSHPLSFAGPTLAQPDELGGGTYLSLPRAPFAVGGNSVSLPGSSPGGGSLPGDGSVPVFQGGAFGTPSLSRGLVSLSRSTASLGYGDPSREFVELRVAPSANATVNITGWRLVSEATGAAAVIPQGSEVLTSGVVNAVQDIVLKPGARVIISSGYSPIGGSFRENKCIGYFSSFQQFSPALPQSCPTPEHELSSYYGAGYVRDAACLDYIQTLDRCKVALTPPPAASAGCQSFIVKYLNYNGCIDAHRDDSDFLGNTWRVYLGRTSNLFRAKHEIVKLLDVEGKTVDAFSY